MMVTTPAPMAKPAPVAPAAPAPTGPAGAPPAGPKVVDDAAPPAATGAAQAAAGAKPDASKPDAAGGAAPKDAAAAAKQAALEQLEATTAVDAMTKVDDHLAKISALSVGGGTPEGTKSAQIASALLTDASMLMQHAHVKAAGEVKDMPTELHMRLMSSASGLAFLGGQVAIAGQSKEAVKLADVVAGPVEETKAVIGDITKLIAPPAEDGAAPAAGGGAPAEGAPPAADTAAAAAATPAGPDAKATPPAPPAGAAPTGNTGVVPASMQHVTPGPGAGTGPNPA